MRARPTARERTYSGDQGWEHQYRTAAGTSLSPDSHFRRILESLITASRANVLTLPPTSCHSPIRVLIMLRACSFDSSTAKSFVQHRAEYFKVIVNRVSSLWRRDFFDP